MKPISDEDLTLLYYGEHDDASLAARVARTPELQARFEALGRELDLADAWVPPERGEAYGAEVWQRIAPSLAPRRTGLRMRIADAWSNFSQPRFSMAGALSLLVVAVLAFMLGRNGNELAPGDTLPMSTVDMAALTAGIDPARVLNVSVSGHLEQLDQVLTQFAHSSESSSNEATWATDVLVANRLYRQAAEQQGQQQLARFLADLEPLLIELAYEAQSASPATRERMQAEVKDGLLFRVRVMNSQLQKSQSSI